MCETLGELAPPGNSRDGWDSHRDCEIWLTGPITRSTNSTKCRNVVGRQSEKVDAVRYCNLYGGYMRFLSSVWKSADDGNRAQADLVGQTRRSDANNAQSKSSSCTYRLLLTVNTARISQDANSGRSLLKCTGRGTSRANPT